MSLSQRHTFLTVTQGHREVELPREGGREQHEVSLIDVACTIYVSGRDSPFNVIKVRCCDVLGCLEVGNTANGI